MLFSPQIISRSRRFGGSTGAEAAAFLARTTGLDGTHTSAYTALINGLVSDGIWSKFDVLRIYATQDSTTALLNLVSTNYLGVAHGSPTFTADAGFTGVDASTTVYIDDQFNPSTAISPQYVQDSAHLSAWNVTNIATASGNYFIGANGPSGGFHQGSILAKYSGDGKAYFRINVVAPTGTQSVTNSDASGHYIGNRDTSSTVQGYRNGSNIISETGQTSVSVSTRGILNLAWNNDGTVAGSAGQIAMVSIGSSLSPTDAGNFYTRLRTYMTTVGVP